LIVEGGNERADDGDDIVREQLDCVIGRKSGHQEQELVGRKPLSQKCAYIEAERQINEIQTSVSAEIRLGEMKCVPPTLI